MSGKSKRAIKAVSFVKDAASSVTVTPSLDRTEPGAIGYPIMTLDQWQELDLAQKQVAASFKVPVDDVEIWVELKNRKDGLWGG